MRWDGEEEEEEEERAYGYDMCSEGVLDSTDLRLSKMQQGTHDSSST